LGSQKPGLCKTVCLLQAEGLPARAGDNDYEEEPTREIIDIRRKVLGSMIARDNLGFTHDPAIGKIFELWQQAIKPAKRPVERVLVCETLAQISSKSASNPQSAMLERRSSAEIRFPIAGFPRSVARTSVRSGSYAGIS
jgi:hypothetical protein